MRTRKPLEIEKTKIASLHFLTQDAVPGKTHAQQAEIACRNGIRWIQVRTKDKSEKQWEDIALSVQKITDKYAAIFILNDNVRLAYRIGADGVHLGKKDMNPIEARKFLGPDFIIGGTSNTEADILQLADAEVDYIGLGPYRFTTTKKELSPVLPKDEIPYLIRIQNKIPVILIGGIVAADIPEIAATGAHGIAVSGAINNAGNPGNAASELLHNTKLYFKL